VAKVTLTISLNSEIDADLLAWWDTQPKGRRCTALRTLWRASLNGANDRRLEALNTQLERLLARLSAGQFVAAQIGQAVIEDSRADEVRAKIGGLGK